MSSMLDVPPQPRGAASWLGLVGTIVAHALLVAAGSYAGVRGVSGLKSAIPTMEMVEVALPDPPAPEPKPEPEPERAPTPTSHVQQAAPPPEPPPPSAAQAGDVLDAKSDVVDFGDTVVTGTGDSYAGGLTDPAGTSKTAVHDGAARGDSGGTGAKPAALVVDLSRPPQLVGSTNWQCPFPLEADDAGIDHATVTLRVSIGADGRVQGVTVSSDPGSGFGREARRCATSKRWSAGLDREGRAVAAVTVVNVGFHR